MTPSSSRLGTYTLSIAGTNEDNNATGDLDIKTGNLTIFGAVPGPTTIDGGDIDRVFDIYVGTYLHNLVITNGLSSVSDAYQGKGGGVNVHSTNVTFNNDIINYNETGAGPSNAGGGIYSDGSNLTLNNVEISHNHVGDGNTIGCGGGIFNYDVAGGGGTLDINSSTINNNTCGSVAKTYYDIGGNGGGIYSSGSDADIFIDLSTISGNQASDGTSQGAGNGGGIFSSGSGSILSITQSVIDNNHAGNNTTNPGGSGGGIANYSGSYVSLLTAQSAAITPATAQIITTGVAGTAAGSTTTGSWISITARSPTTRPAMAAAITVAWEAAFTMD